MNCRIFFLYIIALFYNSTQAGQPKLQGHKFSVNNSSVAAAAGGIYTAQGWQGMIPGTVHVETNRLHHDMCLPKAYFVDSISGEKTYFTNAEAYGVLGIVSKAATAKQEKEESQRRYGK